MTTTTFEFHDNLLNRIGEEAYGWALTNPRKTDSILEIIVYAANVLLFQKEISEEIYEEILVDPLWIAEQTTVRQWLERAGDWS